MHLRNRNRLLWISCFSFFFFFFHWSTTEKKRNQCRRFWWCGIHVPVIQPLIEIIIMGACNNNFHSFFVNMLTGNSVSCARAKSKICVVDISTQALRLRESPNSAPVQSKSIFNNNFSFHFSKQINNACILIVCKLQTISGTKQMPGGCCYNTIHHIAPRLNINCCLMREKCFSFR